jgi:HSP20 family protein
MAMSPYRGRGFYDMHSEMNRLFDEAFGGLMRRPGGQRSQVTEWAPAVDVLQKDGNLVVRAELPGIKPEDVDITVQDRVLTISGEHKVEQEADRGGYFVRERRHGSFRRSMTLPEGVDEDQIHARLENGVLEVTLEGAAAVREPRLIQVESSGGESAGTPNISTEGSGGESPGGTVR